MASTNHNLLLVEGNDERFALPYLMDEHIVWGERKENWAVEIKQFDGVTNLLKPGVIEAESKVPGLKALGLIIDANDSFDSRWAAVRERCRKLVADFPEQLEASGLIHKAANGFRLGVWIMPDNGSRGMLETFLTSLISPDRRPLWDHAQECCERASAFSNCYSASHRDKARVHTYLAWIDPPGLSLPTSVLRHAFDARPPQASNFVTWFINLYQITARETPAP